jgi:hypothetical protein
MAFNQRDFQRIAVHWRSAIETPGVTGAVQGRTMDVSVSGACIQFLDNIVLGTLCRLHLEVPSADKLSRNAVTMQVKVISSTLIGHVSEFRIGFVFQDIAPAIDALLRKHLA